ncbi:hypothetical protein EB796_007291 [Bugula neritina]|uniref:Uncharacterized protein n=1 Tax=Bugula neritina TaxID=10212 RepID=A0A7J7K6Z3_BUGNE|nr:hypothetical protein EB796_007291 [Bugula neritina]
MRITEAHADCVVKSAVPIAMNKCSTAVSSSSKTLNINKEEVVVDSSSQLFSPLGDLYGDETNASSEFDPDEVTDVSFEEVGNGKVKMNFNSHGSRHRLVLTESRKDLSTIKVKLVGKSADEEVKSSSELSHLVEDETLSTSTKTYIEGDSALNRLKDWAPSEEGTIWLPPFDHLMLITGYDIYSNSTGTPTTSTLGGRHDGEILRSAEACSDENYVLGATAGNSQYLENRFLFSCCSQRSFYATLEAYGSCLKESTKDVTDIAEIAELAESYLPGQVYDADDQCYIAFGSKACSDVSG